MQEEWITRPQWRTCSRAVAVLQERAANDDMAPRIEAISSRVIRPLKADPATANSVGEAHVVLPCTLAPCAGPGQETGGLRSLCVLDRRPCTQLRVDPSSLVAGLSEFAFAWCRGQLGCRLGQVLGYLRIRRLDGRLGLPYPHVCASCNGAPLSADVLVAMPAVRVSKHRADPHRLEWALALVSVFVIIHSSEYKVITFRSETSVPEPTVRLIAGGML